MYGLYDWEGYVDGECWYVINCLSKLNPSAIEFVNSSMFCVIFSILSAYLLSIVLISSINCFLKGKFCENIQKSRNFYISLQLLANT